MDLYYDKELAEIVGPSYDSEWKLRNAKVAQLLNTLQKTGFNLINSPHTKELDLDKNYLQVDPHHRFENSKYYFVLHGTQEYLKPIKDKFEQCFAEQKFPYYDLNFSQNIKSSTAVTTYEPIHPWYDDVLQVLMRHNPQCSKEELEQKYCQNIITYKGSSDEKAREYSQSVSFCRLQIEENVVEYIEHSWTLKLKIQWYDMTHFCTALRQVFAVRST